MRYVERFQTTRARLVRLLRHKLRVRGWAEGAPPPDPEAVADRMVVLGYVDDAAYAGARARGLDRRGFGRARVALALRASGVAPAELEAATAGLDPVAAAIAFARRKRLGPFGSPADPAGRRRHLAMMARAGHPPGLSRAILMAPSEEALADLTVC